MSLRVLEDERLGYAILEFDAALAAPSLSISICSRLRQGAYLGPGGQWQRLPHYFAAQRVDGDASSTRYRIGPDIVNHMMEFDRVEVATADKNLREETEWENAVPEISARAAHTLYLAPGPSEREPQPAAGAEPSVAPPPAHPPEREAAPPEPPPASAQPDARPAPPPSPRPTPPWLAAVLALVLLVVGVQSWLLRCQLFGLACTPQHEPALPIAQPAPPVAQPAPPVTPPAPPVAQPPPPVAKAAPPVTAPAPPLAGPVPGLACAEMLIESMPCNVPTCFSAPEARGRPEAQSILDRAEAACLRRREGRAPAAPSDPTGLVGTKWSGTANGRVGLQGLAFEFQANGKMKYWWLDQSNRSTITGGGDATWRQTGDAIHIDANGTFDGRIAGNRMQGTGQNGPEWTWTWSVTKD
ncbi:MAG TPA: hypothetical protein VEK73_18850 [Xanthobacteraceae bacterium]|nr:hypothetical protein [Xanthobacteraceae bacterium]